MRSRASNNQLTDRKNGTKQRQEHSLIRTSTAVILSYHHHQERRFRCPPSASFVAGFRHYLSSVSHTCSISLLISTSKTLSKVPNKCLISSCTKSLMSLTGKGGKHMEVITQSRVFHGIYQAKNSKQRRITEIQFGQRHLTHLQLFAGEHCYNATISRFVILKAPRIKSNTHLVRR